MELEQLTQYADKLSIVLVLLYALMREAKRADRLEEKLVTTLERRDLIDHKTE